MANGPYEQIEVNGHLIIKVKGLDNFSLLLQQLSPEKTHFIELTTELPGHKERQSLFKLEPKKAVSYFNFSDYYPILKAEMEALNQLGYTQLVDYYKENIGPLRLKASLTGEPFHQENTLEHAVKELDKLSLTSSLNEQSAAKIEPQKPRWTSFFKPQKTTPETAKNPENLARKPSNKSGA